MNYHVNDFMPSSHISSNNGFQHTLASNSLLILLCWISSFPTVTAISYQKCCGEMTLQWVCVCICVYNWTIETKRIYIMVAF